MVLMKIITVGKIPSDGSGTSPEALFPSI
jgi:hypothetical protein